MTITLVPVLIMALLGVLLYVPFRVKVPWLSELGRLMFGAAMIGLALGAGSGLGLHR